MFLKTIHVDVYEGRQNVCGKPHRKPNQSNNITFILPNEK
jgi:hypothetical protein